MWDGDLSYFRLYLIVSLAESSKPTVWDGDLLYFIVNLAVHLCSKPTVWDGDLVPCTDTSLSSFRRSKPTVWDGDSYSIIRVLLCASF